MKATFLYKLRLVRIQEDCYLIVYLILMNFYLEIFALGLILLLLGILYLIFFVKEVIEAPPNDAAVEASDPKTLQITENGTKEVEPIAKKSCLREFFDPAQAYECIKVLLKKRANHVQTFLILLVVSYGLFVGPQLGLFILKQLELMHIYL